MVWTLNLRRTDIRERQEVIVPGTWQLTPGTQIHVALAAGRSGILETIRQIDPNIWLLRWSRKGSSFDGKTFELASLVSTAAAPGSRDRKLRLSLVLPRLTRKEIVELRRQLAQWQAPADMARLVDGAGDRIGSTNLFNQSGLAFLRDAWIAAEFGRIRQADQVRLVDDEWPDFEAMVDGRIERCEAVEVDNPKRRRGDEYRNSKHWRDRTRPGGGLDHACEENSGLACARLSEEGSEAIWRAGQFGHLLERWRVRHSTKRS